MAKNLDAKCKLCRRAATKLYLKGDRCYTTKCEIIKRNYPPGVAGAKNSKPRLSGYGIQLREKQKARQYYGLSEKQFNNYYKSSSAKIGNTGDNMIQLLEGRLDNVIYRLGWAVSHGQARQFVNHSYFRVNGKRMNIPSYQVKAGDVITIGTLAEKYKYFQELLPNLGKKEVPGWLHSEQGKFEAKAVKAGEWAESRSIFNMQSIIEYYSR